MADDRATEKNRRPSPHDIDHLRERLRALGYLDAPVDRFVLGSATARSGAVRFALGAGLRVGLIAGLLLGISAAIALAVRAPGFIATRRDAIVMAAVLSAVFALVTAVAVAATVMAASWLARRSTTLTAARARRVAATAGIIVALGCAAYLTLWWTAAQDLFTGLTIGWNVVALALAAGVALLLAHAVSVVIQAALVRSTVTADISAGGLLSSRAFLAVFGLLLFAGSGALMATGAGRDRAPDAGAAPITVVPTGYALRVLAIDGFDLTIGQRLKADLPALSRLLDGAYLPLGSDAAPDPARDWTTIATGQPPEVHGIASLEARRAVGIDGRLPAARGGIVQSLLNAADLLRLTTPAIASGAERRVPAFWEVASAAGLRTAVVNWWATWPAPAGDDIVITDRALLRLDTGGELDAEIAPAALYEQLRARWPSMRSEAAERAAAQFGGIADPALRAVMTRSAEIDLLVTHIANRVDDQPLDLLVVYLPGLDIAQHNLLQAGAPSSVAAMRARVEAIEAYYRFLNGVVGMLMEPSPSHVDAAMLWPGRAGSRQGGMLLSGAPIDPAGTVCEDCPIGAAGTLLYLLGLPVADDLRWSSPQTGLVTREFNARHPVRRIPSYGAAATRPGARTGQPLDAEALERLRSLGYIR
ncbi:MAG TPA: alkaline phosphatase family protein [Vicinamibacterales bacterium]|nr:alkaline phosphatase family protein [Vicinamibacterales bacterium]